MSQQADATPEELLKRTLKTFHTVIDFALRVSLKLNGQPTTVPGEMASIVHTKMCINATSAEHLCGAKLFDHSAIMTVCRMCMEAMTLYYYLNEEVDATEWDCRELVLRLHDTCARIKLTRATREEGQYQDLLDGRDSLKQDLENNAFFKSKAAKMRAAKLLSGDVIFIGGMRAAAVRAAGWREEQFVSLYNYLSQHVHTAPMAFMRVRKHNVSFSEPGDAQRCMVALALNIAEFCLLRVSMHYLASSPATRSEFGKAELEEFETELQNPRILTGK